MVHHLDRPDGLSAALGLAPEEFRRSCHLLSDSMMAVGSSSPAKYQIDRSLRFKGAQWMTRTNVPGSGGHIATYSAWVKLGAQTPVNTGHLIYGYSSGIAPSDGLHFNTDGTIRFYGQGEYDGDMNSTAMFRDYSAWYHIVCAVDTTQATGSERLKIYVNGNRQTLAGGTRSTYPSLNHVLAWTTPNCPVALGRENNSLIDYFDGYMADVHLIDGQALSPSSFGKFDDNGVWVPIRYSGAYGTNGCKLEFKDAANLGADTSGRGNHWTVNGLTAADQMKDTPSNNFATLNPLIPGETTLSNGNLTISGVNSLWQSAIPTIQPFGKNYWEVSVASATSCRLATCGIADAAHVTSATAAGPALSFVSALEIYFNENWTSGGINADVSWFSGGTLGFTLPLADFQPGTSPILRFAFDGTTGRLWLGTSSGWYGPTGTLNGDPANGNNPTATVPTSAAYVPVLSAYYPTDKVTFNAGQSPFAYTPPEGFKTLCTANMPAVGIKKPRDHFNAVLYTGNGDTQTVTGLGFKPGLLALKNRSFGWSWSWHDEVRGVSKALASDNTNAEYAYNPSNDIAYGYVSSLDNDGFSVVCGTQAHSYANYNGEAYVGFAWKGAGTATLNNDGTIPSQVSANPTAGFSIVSFSTDGVSGRTVGHGLGAEPVFTILKARDPVTTNHWYVHHRDGCPPSAGTGMALNLYIPPSQSYPSLNSWSSAILNLRTLSAGKWIAYCFTEITGYSKFGSYVGNGSDNGPFVHCGFRPRYLLIKDIGTNGNWVIHDTARTPYSGNVGATLNTNAPDADSADHAFDDCANGFKLRGNPYGDFNYNGRTYIYAAFAEHPFGGSNVSPSPAR